MTSDLDHLTDWRENERAFEAALSELKGPAAAAGLVLDQPHDPMEGWPHVLHAEVRPAGSLRVLSCLDVGLNKRGAMLVQALPGEVRTFARFEARDKEFYLKRLRHLVEAAQAGGA